MRWSPPTATWPPRWCRSRRSGGRPTGSSATNDGWTDLKDDYRLDEHSQQAGPGNVVQTGRIPGVTGKRGHQSATLTLGFGRTGPQARRTANDSKAISFQVTKRRYDRGWHHYLGSLKRVPASARDLRQAVRRLGSRARRRRGQAEPGRVRGLPIGTMGVGRRRPGSVFAVRCLSPGVVAGRLPVRYGAVGDGRQGCREANRALAVHRPAEGRRFVPAKLHGHRRAGLDRAAARRGRAADRAGPPRGAGRPGDVPARQEGSQLPRELHRRRDRAHGAVLTPGALGEPVRLLPELDRRTDLRPGLRRPPGAEERRRCVRGPVARARGRVEVEGQALDGHPERSAERPAVLPAPHQGRQAECGHDVRNR